MGVIPRSEIVIFDNDGTLVPSHEVANPAIQEAFALFCRERGVEAEIPTDQRIRDLTGQPGELFYSRLLPAMHQQLAGELRAFCLEHEVVAMETRCRFYDGLTPMLRELRARGVRLAVATNGGERYIGAVARRLRYRDLFDRVFFHGLDGIQSKTEMARRALADLGPGAGLFVGDRRADLDAARSVRIPFVACLYGYGAPEELTGADAAVATPADLVSLLMLSCTR